MASAPRAAPRGTIVREQSPLTRAFLGAVAAGRFVTGDGLRLLNLVRFVYGHFGVTLPHTSYGDLVRGTARAGGSPAPRPFYGASHVGIYSSGRFISAAQRSQSPHFTMRGWLAWYYGARRFRRRAYFILFGHAAAGRGVASFDSGRFHGVMPHRFLSGPSVRSGRIVDSAISLK